jgi:2,5-diamino-6-(ribosylamino)-4(3H)-pyrimidinone 5'-phosphate reductase
MPRHCEKLYDNKVAALSTRLKEKEERILRVLECLAEESSKGTPIVVEGKKDFETLRELGIAGKIISAKTGGKSRLDVISEMEKSGRQEIILLLDFDRRGKEWIKYLKQHLEKEKIKANIKFWNELLGLAGREVKDIEGLASYIETLRKKLGEV